MTVEVIFTQGDSRQTGKLVLGDFSGTGYSDEATFGNFTVKLLGVKPAPVSYQTIPKDKYELELVIKTKG